MVEDCWFEKIVDKSYRLSQGELIKSFPIISPVNPESILDYFAKLDPANPEKKPPSPPVNIDKNNVVVMTQECDLENGKTDYVQVCPFSTLAEFRADNERITDEEIRPTLEAIRQGRYVHLHLLNRCKLDDFKEDLLIVDFREVYTLPIEFALCFASTQDVRIKLRIPYREHLSQAFARSFMRVGLPGDIASFVKKGSYTGHSIFPDLPEYDRTKWHKTITPD